MNRRAWIVAGVLTVCSTSWAQERERSRATLAVGDFDGDGKPDVAVGLPNVDAGEHCCAGEVRIFACKDGRLLGVVSGEASGDLFGTSLAAVGDLDADYATDLAVGGSRPWIDFVSAKKRKRIRRLESEDESGAADQLCALGDGSGQTRVDLVVHGLPRGRWRYVSTDLRTAFGRGLPMMEFRGFGCVGDLDGDGDADFAVTTSNFAAAGEAMTWMVCWFPDDAAIRTLQAADTKRSRPWSFIDAAGDWDGDGKGDFLVGVEGDDGKSPWTLHVFSSAEGTELWKAVDPVDNGPLVGMAAIGDVDGDGRRDVVVAMPQDVVLPSTTKPAVVALISTKTRAPIWTARGKPGDGSADDVRPCGDVDGDGVGDLVVLVPRGGGRRGAVRTLSGKTGATIALIDELDMPSLLDVVTDAKASKAARRFAARELLAGADWERSSWATLPVLSEWMRDLSVERVEAIQIVDRLWRNGELEKAMKRVVAEIKSALVDAAKRPADKAVAKSEAVVKARYAALVALQSGADDADVSKLLWSVAKDESDDAMPRIAAVRGLSEGGVLGAETVPDWAAVAKSKDQDVRQAVADNLVRAKAPEFDAVLEPLQFDAKDLTRAGAIESQTERRRPTLLARFDELMEDSYEYVRFFAMYAAGVLKSETSGQPQRVAMILRLLETSDEPVDVTGALLAMTMLTGETFGVKPTDVHVREQDVDEKALAAFVADNTARKQAADAWRAKFSVDCVWTDADRAKTLEKLLAHADPKNVERAKAELEALRKAK